MKKLMATVLLALMAAGVCSAQWYVGGAISYGTKHTTTGNDVRTSEFSFTPRVGYVFNDRMLAGLQVAYANSCEKTTISDVIDLTSETTLLETRNSSANSTSRRLPNFSLTAFSNSESDKDTFMSFH